MMESKYKKLSNRVKHDLPLPENYPYAGKIMECLGEMEHAPREFLSGAILGITDDLRNTGVGGALELVYKLIKSDALDRLAAEQTELWICDTCAYDRRQSGAECINCNSPAPVGNQEQTE